MSSRKTPRERETAPLTICQTRCVKRTRTFRFSAARPPTVASVTVLISGDDRRLFPLFPFSQGNAESSGENERERALLTSFRMREYENKGGRERGLEVELTERKASGRESG